MAAASTSADPVKRHRLHIGGLTPSITASDLQSRFSSFGKVVSVEGADQLNAVGDRLRYAFLELEATDAQIKRCMNLLSGTTWKGALLRLAPARPDYRARLALERSGLLVKPEEDDGDESEAERSRAARERRRELKLKRKRGIQGFQAKNLELMTKEKLKSGKGTAGWKRDPATGLPIFPIIMRPSRPLVAMSSGGGDAIPSPTRPDTGTPATTKPLTRARRLRIDPTMCCGAPEGGPSKRKRHILGPREMTTEAYRLGFGGGAKEARERRGREWLCEETEDGGVVWSLWGPPSTSSALSDLRSVGGGAETVWVKRSSLWDPPTAAAPRPAPASLTSFSASISPDAAVAPSGELLASNDVDEHLRSERLAHLHILNSVLSASEPSAGALDDVSENTKAVVERQKARERNMGTAWLYEADTQVEVVRSEEQPLRLRGGAGSEDGEGDANTEAASSSSDSSSGGGIEGADSATSVDSSSEGNDSDGSENEGGSTASTTRSAEDLVAPDAASSSTSTLQGQTASDSGASAADSAQGGDGVKMASLTSMFKARPKENDAGFSLFGDGDLGDVELEDHSFSLTEQPESAEPGTTAAGTATTSFHPSRLAALRDEVPVASEDPTAQPMGGSLDDNDEPLFFPFPMEGDDELAGILEALGEEERQRLRKRCRFHPVPVGTEGWRTFERTQTVEEIAKEHDATKRALTEQMRRRHKDALKQIKKGRSLAR